jgi:hypothetical protein
MLRNRLLILLGGCFLAVSAAWADEVGYVDCSNHSEDTQVFGKARKTPELVASVPCGERFTVLVYGFVFSRIQTRDGNVGYIYSNLIAVDRAATAAQQTPSAQLASAKVKLPSTRAAVAHPAPTASIQPQPALAQPEPTPAPGPASPAPISPVPISNVPETAAAVVQPTPTTPAQPQLAPDHLAQTQVVTAPAAPEAIPNTAETTATVVQPNPPAPAQPEPVAAEPAAPAIRPASARTSWEKPRAGGVRRAPVLELFGGYAFARLDGGGGTTSNLNGALGSFGWNIKPWLQIVADTSYSFVTTNGTKNVLYGNHYGPRYFHRGHNRWGATPFVEALVGGSRADTTLSGSSVYNTSQNCFSFKVGGGLDIHPSRHIDIRLFDVDYYRTSFGTNLHQNNYWASTGIVLRLFGGGSQ